LFRRRDVLDLVLKYKHKRGVQARIATVLGVSESTVRRDISATLYAPNLCRECGGYKPRQFQFKKVS
jgi:DeoR/GlpR family transcriptional regulator of sugar metabolism